jgi:hypothetical protein
MANLPSLCEEVHLIRIEYNIILDHLIYGTRTILMNEMIKDRPGSFIVACIVIEVLLNECHRTIDFTIFAPEALLIEHAPIG